MPTKNRGILYLLIVLQKQSYSLIPKITSNWSSCMWLYYITLYESNGVFFYELFLEYICNILVGELIFTL